jgi:hypothetical protein
MGEERTLNVLLARALIALTRAFEQAGAGTDGVPSLPAWAGMLRVIDEQGVDQRDIPHLARISTRVVVAWLKVTERSGWTAAAGDKRVALTAAGVTARTKWAQLPATVEAAWAKQVGSLDELRSALAAIVEQLPLELPHYPIPYGTADPSITGGRPHGQDWRPVPRADGDTTTGLPLHALLSQALVGFTIDVESRGIGPLAAAINVLCRVGVEGRPLAEIPKSVGLTGTGKSGTERHGLVTVNNKRATLTPLGKRVVEAYPRAVADVEASWDEQFSAKNVAALRTALAALPTDDTLPDHPIVMWTADRGFDELSAQL